METLHNIFQAGIIQRLGWTLVHFAWQATAIGVILAILLKLLHKSSANLRYIIACTALALIVLMPAVTIRMVNASVETVEPAKTASLDLSKTGAGTQAIVEMPQAEPPAKQQKKDAAKNVHQKPRASDFPWHSERMSLSKAKNLRSEKSTKRSIRVAKHPPSVITW